MSTNTLVIDPDGRLSFVYQDELAGLLGLGPGRVVRASTVEPDGAGGWREESDRWTEALALVDLAREAWRRAGLSLP